MNGCSYSGLKAVHQVALVALVALCLCILSVNQAEGQDGVTSGWTLIVDGQPEAWPDHVRQAEAQDGGLSIGEATADSTQMGQPTKQRHERLLAYWRSEGYLFAQIDSVREGQDLVELSRTTYASRGPQVEVGSIRLSEQKVLAPDAARALLNTRPGRVFRPAVLEADIEALLRTLDSRGYPLAEIRIDSLHIASADTPDAPAQDNPQAHIVLGVSPGVPVRVGRVEVNAGVRTQPGYVARTAGVRVGQLLAGYEPERMAQRLLDTGHFSSVEPPTLWLENDSVAVLRFEVQEASPGAFDIVLGYLPPAPGGNGQLVGNGNLLLRNLFGGGRIMSLQLNRLPGQTASVEVDLADPMAFGWPLKLALGFRGLQQDSTFSRQHYSAEVGYQLVGGLELVGTFTRESARPGQRGLSLTPSGVQRIPSGTATFFGIGIGYTQLDRLVNPRRGYQLDVNVERGQKERTLRQRTELDTLRTRQQFRQERLQGQVRGYIPTFARQLVVVGGEMALLLSSAYDASELFRVGGASSLRGYDEDRFRGRWVGRGLIEYRYQLDRTSFAYLFADLGYIDTPPLEGQPGFVEWYPGYGLGIQFQTAVGLVNASYAFSPEDGPSNGRIHVGLSFGL